MSIINILDSATIDRIAAGEVVERPANVVKELVENAIDAGSNSITVEIKDGGISFIRVSDNGCGIDADQLERAFMRHATSKIVSADDLSTVTSLGFRGEALSSISAVSQVELVTKTKAALCGMKAACNGGVYEPPEEIGAPDGTTILVRNIFYNTPARRKFLKTPMTESGYISEILQHMALSHPEVAFKFINAGQTKFYTSGNNDLKEVIYRIYGKETSDCLLPISCEKDGMKMEGYIGKPILNRSNRGYETTFINSRYIKSPLIYKTIEDGYKGYLMQHKYPFCVLHISLDTNSVDVNVHPTKMDIRILNPEPFIEFVSSHIQEALQKGELIPEDTTKVTQTMAQTRKQERELTSAVPEPFEAKRLDSFKEISNYQASITPNTTSDTPKKDGITETFFSEDEEKKVEKMISNPIFSRVFGNEKEEAASPKKVEKNGNVIKQKDQIIVHEINQLTMFDESIMNADKENSYEILGQLFNTYWILAFQEKMYLVDQHAAHEKVKYEQFVKHLHKKELVTQNLNPPVIVNLTDKEKQIYLNYHNYFEQLGFFIEEFGGNDYAIRAVPVDLYGCSEKELFLSVIDELMDLPKIKDNSLILDKIASMSCKAAVKGNTRLSLEEAKLLMKELFACENPFQCPHGRPTIISMSKYEIDKKFKRIL